MGKYDTYFEEGDNGEEQHKRVILVLIANELAESNRLKRMELLHNHTTIENDRGTTIHVAPISLEDLQDQAWAVNMHQSQVQQLM